MKILEKELPLFPLQIVLFPQARVPLQVFEPRYLEMVERCVREDLAFGVVLIKEGSEVGDTATPFMVGTVARLVDVAQLDDGRMSVIAAGITRFKVRELSNELPYLTASVQVWRDEDVDLAKAEGVARLAAKSFERYIQAMQSLVGGEEQEEEQKERTFTPPKDPTVLSYLIAANLQISLLDKQSLLETSTVIRRLRREIMIMERELELLRLVSEQNDKVLDQGTFSLN